VPDASLPLYACTPGWGDHLAHSVYAVQGGLHRPAAFRVTLPPDVPGGRPRCPVGDPWRTELGAVCGALSHLSNGALSPGLCVRPPQSGDGLDAVWAPLAHVFPGG